MIVFVLLILCFGLLAVVKDVVQDIKTPPFILASVWVIIHFVIILYWGDSEILDSYYYAMYFVGILIFTIGYSLFGNKKGISDIQVGIRNTNIRMKKLGIQLTTIFVSLFVILYFVEVYSFLSTQKSVNNVWQFLAQSKRLGLFTEPVLVSYSRVPVTVLCIIMGVLYFSNPIKRNRNYFILYLNYALFYALTAGNRGAVFSLLISLLFSFLIVKNYDNRILFKIFIRVAIVLLSLFVISSFAKFVYEDQSDVSSFVNHHIKLYFTSSSVAFVEWCKGDNELLHGEHTFRFFISIYEALGGDVKAKPLAQEFVYINDVRTNVFTMYHFYAADFGIVYALFVQLLIGVFYGWLYRKSVYLKEFSVFHVVILSMFYFPLVNQFFDDKYISLLSTWLQTFFWAWIFTRNEFLKKNAE